MGPARGWTMDGTTQVDSLEGGTGGQPPQALGRYWRAAPDGHGGYGRAASRF